MGAQAWEGLLGAHKGFRIRLKDARRLTGLRPHAQPLPLPWLLAAPRSSTAFILFLQSTPSPKAHKTQYLLSLTPLSSPSLLLAVPGPHREPPAAPAATETFARTPPLFPSAPAIFVPFFTSHSSLLPLRSSSFQKRAASKPAQRLLKGNLKLPSRG